jgi:hypothetical protein
MQMFDMDVDTGRSCHLYKFDLMCGDYAPVGPRS